MLRCGLYAAAGIIWRYLMLYGHGFRRGDIPSSLSGDENSPNYARPCVHYRMRWRASRIRLCAQYSGSYEFRELLLHDDDNITEMFSKRTVHALFNKISLLSR